MNTQKQSGLNSLLESLKTLPNDALINDAEKECAEESLGDHCDESLGDSITEIDYQKIIEEQNKKIESLENQLKEALNANLVRLIQEYI